MFDTLCKVIQHCKAKSKSLYAIYFAKALWTVNKLKCGSVYGKIMATAGFVKYRCGLLQFNRFYPF